VSSKEHYVDICITAPPQKTASADEQIDKLRHVSCCHSDMVFRGVFGFVMKSFGILHSVCSNYQR